MLLVLAGCHRLDSIEIDDPKAHWAGGGFAEMVPPIRRPTSADKTDLITVWLRVPAGGRIGVRSIGDGRPTLVYPPGTESDRVELHEPVDATEHAWEVMDVRGTRLEAAGRERFHCLQPTGRDKALAGFEWRRDDDSAERAAADGLAKIAAVGSLAELEPEDRLPLLARLRRLNHCQPCHEHDRPECRHVGAPGPRRATDGAGFYSTLAVLSDSAPIERHRPHDLNAEDPFVSIERAGDDAAPVARLDFARALASGRPHEQAVCRSRKYLFDHMDDAARQAFAKAFAECGIP